MSQRALSVTPSGRVRARGDLPKSAYLTFSVTVRPRTPVRSHHPQTWSMRGWSSAHISSKVVRLRAKVFSDPIDFRSRLAWTGRSSMPRAMA